MKALSSWPDPQTIHTIGFDFDGVFTDNKVYQNQSGEEWVRCDRGDGLGLNLLRAFAIVKALDIKLFIVSKEKNPVVEARAKKLRIDCWHGIDNKLTFVKQFLSECHPQKQNPMEGFIYLGNDLNDLLVIEAAGFSVVPMDAHDLVKERASAIIPKLGGDGFVRAFIEKFIGLKEFTWGGDP